jgi:hydrogenase maturation protein HypF
MKKLKKENFTVLIHKKLPPNDGCIALGQAVVTDARIKSGKIICGFYKCK